MRLRKPRIGDESSNNDARVGNTVTELNGSMNLRATKENIVATSLTLLVPMKLVSKGMSASLVCHRRRLPPLNWQYGDNSDSKSARDHRYRVFWPP